MAIKIGTRGYDLLRESDGRTPICHCGCGECIESETKVFWLYHTRRSLAGGLTNTGGPWSIVKFDHLVAQQPHTKLDLDSLKSLMVALSNAEPETLKKLYVFCHDALNCRV